MTTKIKSVKAAKAGKQIKTRLEYLRGELRAGNMSYGETFELQSLAKHIAPGDVELLEAAGVPEFPADQPEHTSGENGCAADCPACAAERGANSGAGLLRAGLIDSTFTLLRGNLNQ
jgi:hypothetical protein